MILATSTVATSTHLGVYPFGVVAVMSVVILLLFGFAYFVTYKILEDL